MTYKEFKDYVEGLGVTDDTELYYKDMNFGDKDGELTKYDLSLFNNILLFASIYWEPCD